MTKCLSTIRKRLTFGRAASLFGLAKGRCRGRRATRTRHMFAFRFRGSDLQVRHKARPHLHCHSERSDPAFSSARFPGAGSRREESTFAFRGLRSGGLQAGVHVAASSSRLPCLPRPSLSAAGRFEGSLDRRFRFLSERARTASLPPVSKASVRCSGGSLDPQASKASAPHSQWHSHFWLCSDDHHRCYREIG